MATPDRPEEWSTLKIEVEPGQFFWFGGPFTAADVWGCALEVLTMYGKPFPLSMSQVKRHNLERGVTILPDEGNPGTVKVLAAPAFHLWCGVPQAVVEAQMVAEEHQLEELFRGHRAA